MNLEGDILPRMEVRTCKYCGENGLGIVRGALGCTGDIWVCSVCNKQTNTLRKNIKK